MSDLLLVDSFGKVLGAAPDPPTWLGDQPPAAEKAETSSEDGKSD